MFGRTPRKPTPEEIADNRTREIATEVFAQEILKPESALAIIESCALDKELYARLKLLVEKGSPRLGNENRWTPQTRKVTK